MPTSRQELINELREIANKAEAINEMESAVVLLATLRRSERSFRVLACGGLFGTLPASPSPDSRQQSTSNGSPGTCGRRARCQRNWRSAMRTQLREVKRGESVHPRELARRAIRQHAESQPGGVAQVHDINRTGDPAPILPVDKAVDSATYIRSR